MNTTLSRTTPTDVGERIKALRAERRLTLADLAGASGLTRSFLSKLERGKSAVSVASLLKIAAALDLSLEALLEPSLGVSVARAEEVNGADSSQGATQSHPLTPTTERRIQGNRHILARGETLQLEPLLSGQVEFVFVLSGTLEIVVAERATTLREGDSITISSPSPRRIHNPDHDSGVSFLYLASPAGDTQVS